MFGVLVVTHGRLAHELLEVAFHIMGSKLDRIRALGIPFLGVRQQQDPASRGAPFETRRSGIEQAMQAAIEELDSEGRGVLILTDILGGTAFQVARELTSARPGPAVVISGVSLPMLLKIPSLRDLPVEQAGPLLVERVRRAVVCQGFGGPGDRPGMSSPLGQDAGKQERPEGAGGQDGRSN